LAKSGAVPFSHPLLLLIGGLLGEVWPANSLLTAGRLTNSENIVQDVQEDMAIIAMTTSHILHYPFFISS
jgi:hypothetical protein